MSNKNDQNEQNDQKNILNIDRTYLFKIFKKTTGMSVRNYIISLRMKNAAQLLENGKNVTEAAFLCGFSCQSNFSKMFNAFFGISHTDYKKRHS